MKPVISLVLGSFNRKTFLKKTLRCIRENGITVPYEMIVIDGGSTDGSARYLSKQKDVITIIQHNFGMWDGKQLERKSWGYFMNIAFRAAHGKYVLMLSDDSLLVPGSVMNGYVEFEERLKRGEGIGAIAFYFRNYPGDTQYFISRTLGNRLYLNHGLFLKSALEDINYIDEDNYFFYHGDADLSLRLWEKGYQVIEGRKSFLEHFKHANVKERKTALDRQKHEEGWNRLITRWASLYDGETPNTVVRRKYIEHKDTTDTARYIRQTADYWKYRLYLKLIRVKKVLKKITGSLPTKSR